MSAGAKTAFLRRLIDDAGLFPPAKLPMDAALAEDAASRAGPHAFARRGGQPHVRWCRRRAQLDAIEVRLPDGDEGIRMLTRLRDDRFAAGAQLDVFLEVPLGDDWEFRIPHTLERIAEGGYNAKLRCGGVVAEAFPSPQQVARFISAARDHKVRMKATAGLHHPIRHVEAASGFHMHGFLNVVGAAILTHAYDFDIPAIEQILWDEDPRSFTLDEGAFGWHEYRVDTAGIQAARGALFDAYGSCSFTEPIADLRGLGIL